MPRPESPIDPAGPLAEFASGLRALRNASNLGYRELAEKANYSTAVLSQAASGRSLPTWEATRAFVRACGGDEESWRVRYEAAAQKWRQQRGTTHATNHQRRRTQATTDRDGATGLALANADAKPSSASASSSPPQHPQVAEATDAIGSFVQRLRHLRGMVGNPSIDELSKIAAIPRSTVSDLLAGRYRRPPRWELVSAVVAACVQLGRQQEMSLPANLASLETWRHHHTNLSLFLDGATWVESPPIRVMLAEDMDLLRTALVSMLSEEKDIEVVVDLRCDHRVVSTAQRFRPDVMVMSADDPETPALEVIRELRRLLPDCQVVALTTQKAVGLLKRLLAADVAGLIDKNAPAVRLLHAIRNVAQGGTVIDANLVVTALSVASNPFTQRELAVLRMVAEGAATPEIARQLSLSPATVRQYLSNAMNKTGGRTRIDAMRIATASGWL